MCKHNKNTYWYNITYITAIKSLDLLHLYCSENNFTMYIRFLRRRPQTTLNML